MRLSYAIWYRRTAHGDHRVKPHAGEDGRMGTEDDAIIRPVIEKLQAEG